MMILNICGLILALLCVTKALPYRSLEQDDKASIKKSEPFWFGRNSDEQPYVFGIGKRELARLFGRNREQEELESNNPVIRTDTENIMPDTYMLIKREPYDFGIGK